ncbi:AfsA-related hotdog domain-containing protein [Streptantibioticus cattleyicolor]|uniref:A-factor biosynthesis protein AfsA-like protein n=1 Tax=Streptantibioticus cattleyicolor (strain ATCC 35852 / DSM 46488 / JCM 4925 / NBRC 14057 / NRRL 8057) TaxID=1003195 RepID=F8JIT4_STREN|nr:AfsA-related hotdog domain-containing protein [Streptantibioticus cattleyicolor]AEW98984.1 A-factor biosynthesis protein AfsA-like protein [Streptantibioticus cattleyicolor NRRL 8057 = DSM 46488]CCB71973.1 putative A-factor biosynthesis protein AfsA homolog [Streptantibioticus cattleyicolor NRRL 8057 = DSM 46488]
MDGRNGIAQAPLSWSRTVARELVHRVSVAEVLLTDVRALGGDRFVAAAQWPRSHPTFTRGADDLHSPLLLVETVRQLGIYIPLLHYSVPSDAHFVIRDVAFELDPEAEPRAGYGATEITCAVTVRALRPMAPATAPGASAGARTTANTPTEARGHTMARGTLRAPERTPSPGRAHPVPGNGAHPATPPLAALRMQVRFQAGNRTFARADGGARFIDPERYREMRRFSAPAHQVDPASRRLASAHRLSPAPDRHHGPGHPASPAAHTTHRVRRAVLRESVLQNHARPSPDLVGVATPHDVMLAFTGADGGLRVDPADARHPFFFDHGSDHVPGMALLEAGRQAVAVRSNGLLRRPVAGRMRALRFTESDPAALVETGLRGPRSLFRIRQGGVVTVIGTLRYASR